MGEVRGVNPGGGDIESLPTSASRPMTAGSVCARAPWSPSAGLRLRLTAAKPKRNARRRGESMRLRADTLHRGLGRCWACGRRLESLNQV